MIAHELAHVRRRDVLVADLRRHARRRPRRPLPDRRLVRTGAARDPRPDRGRVRPPAALAEARARGGPDGVVGVCGSAARARRRAAAASTAPATSSPSRRARRPSRSTRSIRSPRRAWRRSSSRTRRCSERLAAPDRLARTGSTVVVPSRQAARLVRSEHDLRGSRAFGDALRRDVVGMGRQGRTRVSSLSPRPGDDGDHRTRRPAPGLALPACSPVAEHPGLEQPMPTIAAGTHLPP